MQEADVDNSGTIDYGEFVAATLHLNKIEKEDHLFGAFSYFDKDGSGHVNAHELQQACDEFGINAPLEELIQDVDQDNVFISTQRVDYTDVLPHTIIITGRSPP
ncbi:putative non-specific serine/threonine protein kinase [Helianthus annuus]|nr:putative non-specific serine/threonine protein kinase [Helianthus annuus]